MLFKYSLAVFLLTDKVPSVRSNSIAFEMQSLPIITIPPPAITKCAFTPAATSMTNPKRAGIERKQRELCVRQY
ncbi:Uncharacterized protein APZ42_033230 [Daphnia magna]|uniref:Uncharacterized protein n=1 Tax=Daphnia magna TaxID=35525 RepID=A0A164L8K6_9CRUS|nr:Uncharacterized protein APZ42_033230 [Daphnia magna]